MQRKGGKRGISEFIYQGRWKNTYSRRHSGHRIITLSSPSPWMPILVPQKSHLLRRSNPRYRNMVLPCIFTDFVAVQAGRRRSGLRSWGDGESACGTSAVSAVLFCSVPEESFTMKSAFIFRIKLSLPFSSNNFKGSYGPNLRKSKEKAASQAQPHLGCLR